MRTVVPEMVAALIGAENLTVELATVEKPSSALIVVAFGRKGVTGPLIVPSVEPLK